MKNILVVAVLLVSLVIVSAFGCCNTKIVEEGNVMIPGARPLIDINQPVNAETATFSLG